MARERGVDPATALTALTDNGLREIDRFITVSSGEQVKCVPDDRPYYVTQNSIAYGTVLVAMKVGEYNEELSEPEIFEPWCVDEVHTFDF